MSTTAQTLTIQNDRFRTSLGSTTDLPGQIVMTRGVAHHPKQVEIIANVRNFNDFSEANDPHGEHDFGSFDVGSDKFFWKIDYYDSEACEYGAEDPLKSFRVLTVMLAEEY
jgi:hypothetical protein